MVGACVNPFTFTIETEEATFQEVVQCIGSTDCGQTVVAGDAQATVIVNGKPVEMVIKSIDGVLVQEAKDGPA